MRRAVIDDRLAVRALSQRALVYTTPARPDEDRPPHVRAGSGVAVRGDELFVVQDDASFIARVRGDEVTAIPVPHVVGDRRRFESALGNKLDKLDLESAVIVGDELWAFGSASLPVRERICRLRGEAVTIIDAAALYAGVRDAVGSALNIEGVAVLGDELWLCHRGNTGRADPGPAIARLGLAACAAFLDGGPCPAVRAVDRYDLGSERGVRLGFTDAFAVGDRVFFLAAAEDTEDAIADGDVVAARIGVIDREGVRTAPLALALQPEGREAVWPSKRARTADPPLKAEGLALTAADRAVIVIDPDDPDVPTRLYEVALVGPWG